MARGDRASPSSAPELIWRSPLEPAPRHLFELRLAVDAGERTVAWHAGWEAGPLLQLVDAAGGDRLHAEACAALRLFPTRRGFLTMDEGWRPGGRRGGQRLLALTRAAGRFEVDGHDAPAGTSLVGVAPQGDRLVLFRGGRCELRGWPGDAQLAEWRWYSPGVDWEAGCAWGTRDGGELLLAAVDGSWSRSIPGMPWSWRVHGVGDGVLRAGHRGVRLFRPRGRLLTLLPSTSRWLGEVSVTGAGRAARMTLGGKPRRFAVDLDGDAARVLEAPADAGYLARSTRRPAAAAWHPRRDVVALVRRWPRAAVWTVAGGFLCRLPDGALPLAWLATRDAVLAARDDAGRPVLELWAVPTLG